MKKPAYKRILLKLSGEALLGDQRFGLDSLVLDNIAKQIGGINQKGVETAIVVGGGNIWRGVTAASSGMDRATADYAGMLATMINALALQDALEKEGLVVRTQSAIPMQTVAEPYIRRRAIRHLEKGRVVIFAAGTGNPYMTTDTAAALRAVEISAEILLMAKNRIDGVYDSNPLTNKEAKKFKTLSYTDALNLHLEVTDSTALSLCSENHLPIIVFDLQSSYSIERVVASEDIGTLITARGAANA